MDRVEPRDLARSVSLLIPQMSVILAGARDWLFDFALVRWGFGIACLARAYVFARQGRRYRALADSCRVDRVVRIAPLRKLAQRTIDAAVTEIHRSTSNPVVDSYLADPAATACASLYSITGRGHRDIFRDVIVLKERRDNEKGVILLKYARTFSAAAALFDLERLMDRYTFVLEPCWAGYSDPSLLMFITPGQPVFVQCFTTEDYAWVERIGDPFVPIHLGPADWVDVELFRPSPVAKTYDVAMVANWAPHKRHRFLFQSLARVDRPVKVLLIGFPWAGRTAADVRREADAIQNPNVTVDIVENVVAAEVARQVSAAKVFVFLSRKEGDNKALVEAMFANVPAVVYAHTIGGARSRINPATGVLAADHELTTRIFEVIDQPSRFSPREWALEHTGSANATRILDQAIARTRRLRGERYTTGIVEKTNSPNLAYKDPRNRSRFQADYDFILSCRRGAAAFNTPAVA
jgi:glycosyltransferase involved in cell wall biosynthesis